MVRQQPRPPLLVIGDGIAQHAVIRILGDKTLAGSIDHYARQHGLGRVQRDDGKTLVHAQGSGAGAYTHIDSHALVAHIAPGYGAIV